MDQAGPKLPWEQALSPEAAVSRGSVVFSQPSHSCGEGKAAMFGGWWISNQNGPTKETGVRIKLLNGSICSSHVVAFVVTEHSLGALGAPKPQTWHAFADNQ